MDTPSGTETPCTTCDAMVPKGASHCGACGTRTRAITGKLFDAATNPPSPPASPPAASTVTTGGSVKSGTSTNEFGAHQPTGTYDEEDIKRASNQVSTSSNVEQTSLENALEAAFSDPVREDEALSDADRFAPGACVLDQYRVVRQLGQGGMGAVYLARDDVSGQEVAIKVLPAELAKDKDLRERFNQEARALAALDHDNIVPLLTYATRGDDRYLVMKFVPGKSVDDLLSENHRLDVKTATKIFRSVVEALGYAHSQGVIHRDIKPGNVLLSDDGRIFLVDFGIAKQEEGARITQTGILMGTPQYMSPEQISGQVVDGRSDFYAAGLLLFEMLAGVAPFTGEKTFAILRAHVESPPPDVRTFRDDDLPASVVVCIEKLLAKKPIDRPQTADEVIALLDGETDDVPSPLSSTTTNAPLTSEEKTAPITAAVEQPFFNTARVDALAPPRREPMAAIVMVVVVVALIAGGAALWNWSNRAPEVAAINDAGPSLAPHDVANNKIVAKGNKELKSGDIRNAISLAETVLADDHDNIGAQELLVNAFIANRNLKQAKAGLVNLQILASDAPDFDAKIDEKKKAIADLVAAASARANKRQKVRNALPNELSRKQILAVTRSKPSRAALQLCWEKTVLTRRPNAEGWIRVTAKIDGKTGRVSKIEKVKSSVSEKRFLACVTKVIKGWSFPKFRGSPLVVNYRGDFTGTPRSRR